MKLNVPHPMDKYNPEGFYNMSRSFNQSMMPNHHGIYPGVYPMGMMSDPMTPPQPVMQNPMANAYPFGQPQNPATPYTATSGIRVEAKFDNYLLNPFINIPAGGIWIKGFRAKLEDVSYIHASSEDGEIYDIKFKKAPKLSIDGEWRVAGVKIELDQKMSDYILSHLIMLNGEIKFTEDAIDVLEQTDEHTQLHIHSEFIKARLAELVNEFEFSIKEIEFVEHEVDDEDEYEEKYEYDVVGMVEAMYEYNDVRYRTEFKFIMPKWGYTPQLLINNKLVCPDDSILLKTFLNKFLAGEFKNGG